jgi:hypothetical protein
MRVSGHFVQRQVWCGTAEVRGPMSCGTAASARTARTIVCSRASHCCAALSVSCRAADTLLLRLSPPVLHCVRARAALEEVLALRLVPVAGCQAAALPEQVGGIFNFNHDQAVPRCRGSAGRWSDCCGLTQASLR